MNLPPQPPGPPDLDEAQMARDMKRANRKPLWIVLGVIMSILFLGTCSVGRARSSASSELDGRGYSKVNLRMKGPFSFAFEGMKGEAKCSGNITKTPVSTSMDEFCFTPAPPAPLRTTADILQSNLLRDFTPDGFDKIECQDVPPTDDKTTCVVSASNGTVLTVDVTVSARSADGSWKSFKFITQKRYFVGAALSQQVKDFLPAELAKKKAKVKDLDIDCGKGPFVIEDSKIHCRLTNNYGKKPKIGSVELELGPDGKISRWTAKDL